MAFGSRTDQSQKPQGVPKTTMMTTTCADELIVTSQPIELKLILDGLAEKVRAQTRQLTLLCPEGEAIAYELLAACLDAERQSRIAMRTEPELDRELYAPYR
jgi:hypothetical protein